MKNPTSELLSSLELLLGFVALIRISPIIPSATPRSRSRWLSPLSSQSTSSLPGCNWATSQYSSINSRKISDARWYTSPDTIPALWNKCGAFTNEFPLQSPSYWVTHRCNGRVAKTASLIKCRILNSESESFSWNRFRVLSSDIGEWTKNANNICAAVELIFEAERQRKLTYDIMEIQFALTAA
ncbi:hypothetical protein B0H14DRAFT_2584064 [Mycena olivaceomarginata]|nr:hypothetical protein B0H14DRAFT_2584064 [Mycena olivaceomarginata]